MSNSGALRSLVTEAAERAGATLAKLSSATEASLRAILEQTNVSNPLDTIRTIPDEAVRRLRRHAGRRARGRHRAGRRRPAARPQRRAAASGTCARSKASRGAPQALGKTSPCSRRCWSSPTEYGRCGARGNSGCPGAARTPSASLRVVTTLARAAARPLHAGAFFAPPADTEFARRWRARAAALDGPTALNEVESKPLLGDYGIPLPPERFVQTPDDAVTAAQAIGFPVVLKAVSAALPHKSDAGLVRLNLADAEAVRQAAAEIADRASSLPAPLDGMLVAQHVSGGTEVVLGVQRDVEMGPVVMFGMGGVMVELFKDVSFAPATLDHARAREMIAATRAGRLLQGFRGRKPGDIDALCEALVNLGRLARELGDVIESVDINPLLVREQGVVALDALVVLRPPGAGKMTSSRSGGRHDLTRSCWRSHVASVPRIAPRRRRADSVAEFYKGKTITCLHRLWRRRRLRPVRAHHLGTWAATSPAIRPSCRSTCRARAA